MHNLKKRFSLLLFLLAFALLWGTVPCLAAEGAPAQEILDGILSAKAEGDTEAWIRGELTASAGVGAEWYVLALAQWGTWDLSSYEEALLRYLGENEVRSSASRLKFALCLAAVGSTDGYITEVMEGEGLMPTVFRLHLANNGYGEEATTLVSDLLAAQKADGGWTVMGQESDVDSTAMVLQALAPHKEDGAVAAAVERALSLLSLRQLSSGDYSSFGAPNPESTSQVIIALSALGIDCAEDGRFVKEESTLFDGLLRYRLPSGTFCHAAGGAENDSATAQALDAAVAYLRLGEGRGSLYSLDRANPAGVGNSQVHPTEEGPGYKLWVCLGAVFAAGMAALLLFLCKKRHKKNFIALGLALLAVIGVVLFTDIQTPDGYYGEEEKENVIGEVTLSIRCDAVAGRAEHIPKDGVILAPVTLPLGEGDSVYTLLTDAARKYRIQVENDGGLLPYVSGIAYLYEFDYGELSGWTYFVNGEQFLMSAGEYKPQSGDVIEWRYTTDLGEFSK